MTTAVDGGSIPPISTIGRCRALLRIRVITRKEAFSARGKGLFRFQPEVAQIADGVVG
jgi:hypothetical protein